MTDGCRWSEDDFVWLCIYMYIYIYIVIVDKCGWLWTMTNDLKMILRWFRMTMDDIEPIGWLCMVWLWMTEDDGGRLWVILDDYGLQMTMHDYKRSSDDLKMIARLFWMIVDDYEWSWDDLNQTLDHYGQFRMIMDSLWMIINFHKWS